LSDLARQELHPLLIDGELPAAGKELVNSPYDGSVLAEVATGGGEHVELALSKAYALFRDRDAWLSIPQRIEILTKTADLMRAQHADLALLAASEGGKPLADSRVEVTRAIDGVMLCIDALRSDAGDVIALGRTEATMSRVGFTQKEPIGVVVAVSAFNHPLNLIVHQVAPAVASGCPVIVKPAGDTPLSCIRFVQLLREAGLPNGFCQALITDSNATAEKLVTDKRVAFFSFIGSAKVGWMLKSKLARGTRCALEHGGVAPLLIAGDFDRAAAIAAVLKGGFYHAGQVCVSVQRVYVPNDITESFAKELARNAEQLTVGDPTLASTEVGPLIRPAEVDRVEQWVREACDGGATLLCGGQKLDNNCYAPTVLLNPADDAKISTAEVFGPVVCVYGYDSIDDAIIAANSLPVAFQAAVFSNDIDLATATAKKLDASAVMINDHTAFRDDVMPFAGLRESGLGVGGIPYTFEDMQIDKLIVLKSKSL